MKKLLAIMSLSLITSFNVFAAKSSIPENQISAYKKAVVLAIRNSSFECTVESGSFEGNFGTMINSATSAEIDSDGVQPLLIFKSSSDDNTKQIISLTTSADYKTILTLRGENLEKVTKEVNSGDLRNPSISTISTFQSYGVGVCSKN